MNLLWRSFLRYSAEKSTVGSLRQLDGLEAAWLNSTMPFCNGTILTAPVASAEALRQSFRAALADAAGRGLPWAFFTYDPSLAEVSAAEREAVAAECGMARMLGVEVMTGAVSQLAEPRHPSPPVEYQRVEAAGALAVMQLNVSAYGMPEEMAQSAAGTGAFYGDPAREYGFIAYANGEMVSTATVVEIEGWLYVALVATSPAHQKKGYAEAVMRHALHAASRDLGIDRTSLDATAMGAPVYERMGYQRTGEAWSMYAQHA